MGDIIKKEQARSFCKDQDKRSLFYQPIILKIP